MLLTSPASGSASVPRLGPFRAGFDRQLLSRSVHRGTVRVFSGVVEHFLSVRFDPVDMEIVAVPEDDDPLEPNVRYRFSIGEVRDLDGAVLASAVEIPFTTGSELGPAYRPPTATYPEVAPILASRCATEGCHLGALAPLGLDLSTPDGIRRTAVGAPTQQLTGTASAEGGRGALAFAGLDIISVVSGVGSPANSYLLYKVVGDPHVVGEAMPPEGGPVPALTDAEVRTIAAWITAGAPTE